MKLLYLLGWSLTKVIARLIFRMKVTNKENIPKEGAFILACNHISLADPPLVGSSINRPIHYMAKKELFRNWLFGRILRRVNAHPLNRDGIDRKALEMAADILESGEPLIIFPEGTRARGRAFLPARPGIGRIARNSLKPVVPAYIGGSNNLLSCFLGRRKLHINFGEMIGTEHIAKYKADKDGYRRLSDDIMERIKELKSQANNNAN